MESLDPSKARQKIFYLLALCLLLAALYHFAGLFYKVGNASFLRHATFVALNIFFAYGFLKRPKYIIPLFALFTAQQYYSHVMQLTNLWMMAAKIHWVSVTVLLLLPLGLWALLAERSNYTNKPISIDNTIRQT